MRPQERHELKTNELAEWLFNLPQQIKENLRIIIPAAGGIVLIIILAWWYWYYKGEESARKQIELTNLVSQVSQDKAQIVQSQGKEADSSYVLITTADNIQTAAQNAGSNQAAALALIKRAEALRAELHYRPGTIEQQEIATQMDKAKASYNQAIEKAAGNPSLTAAAKFGLGLCAEDLGNFEDAKKIYGEITTEAKFGGTTAAAQAKERLDMMGDYQQKIEFKPAPKPAAAPAPQSRGPAADAGLAGPYIVDLNVGVSAPNGLPSPAK